MLSFLLSLAAACSEPTATTVSTIPDALSCADCRMLLAEVATVKGAHVRDDSWLAVDSSGRMFLAPSGSDRDILVLAPDGTVVEGFDLPQPVFNDTATTEIYTSPKDQLQVFDHQRRRFVLGGDGALESTGTVPDVPHSLTFPGGESVVLQTMIFTPELIGFPLHLTAPDGTITRSFGADPPLYLPNRPEGQYRVISSLGDGRVWSSFLNQYRIELWDTTGVRLKTLEREADWFQPWAGDGADRPLVSGLRIDEAGLLWVLLLVPDTARTRQDPVEEAHGRIPADAWERMYDTVIEVIDPSRSQLLARQRDDRVFTRFTRDLVYSHRADGGGYWSIDVVRAHLKFTSNTEGG